MDPKDVPGLISEATGNTLYHLARRVPSRQLIVEIGAYQGRSTCFLAAGSMRGNKARVMSIDPWTTGELPGPTARGVHYLKQSTEDAYHQHLKDCGIDALVDPIRSMSQHAPLPNKSIGLLWIDGAHDYESVKADIRRFTPLVARGGYVVIDDFRARSPGVDAAVREFIRATRHRWHWSTRQRPLAIGRKKR